MVIKNIEINNRDEELNITLNFPVDEIRKLKEFVKLNDENSNYDVEDEQIILDVPKHFNISDQCLVMEYIYLFADLNLPIGNKGETLEW